MYYFANLDIIHEFHFGRVAIYRFDDGDGKTGRSGQDQFSCHGGSQVYRVHLPHSSGAMSNDIIMFRWDLQFNLMTSKALGPTIPVHQVGSRSRTRVTPAVTKSIEG